MLPTAIYSFVPPRCRNRGRLVAALPRPRPSGRPLPASAWAVWPRSLSPVCPLSRACLSILVLAHRAPPEKPTRPRNGGRAHATPKKPRYTDAGCSGRRATSALTNRRRHGRSYPGARVRWAALRGSGILPAANQLLPAVRGEQFEKASRSGGSIA